MSPLGFGQILVEHLVKILIFCIAILTFGQNTNIFSPTKTSVDAHAWVLFCVVKNRSRSRNAMDIESVLKVMKIMKKVGMINSVKSYG